MVITNAHIECKDQLALYFWYQAIGNAKACEQVISSISANQRLVFCYSITAITVRADHVKLHPYVYLVLQRVRKLHVAPRVVDKALVLQYCCFIDTNKFIYAKEIISLGCIRFVPLLSQFLNSCNPKLPLVPQFARSQLVL